MASIPYMPFYISDYLADAAHLSTIEHGAYMLLIMTYWQRGESFRANDEHLLSKRLANVARLSEQEFENVKATLQEFFEIINNGTEIEWRHKRIEAELASFRAKSEQRRQAAKLSVSKRSANAKQPLNKSPANAQQKPSYTDTDTDTDTDNNKKKKLLKKKKTSFPKEFCVTQQHRELATKNGWPDPAAEFEAFRDHHLARDNKFFDWDRAFYTWLRNAKDRFPKKTDPPSAMQKTQLCQFPGCKNRELGRYQHTYHCQIPEHKIWAQNN